MRRDLWSLQEGLGSRRRSKDAEIWFGVGKCRESGLCIYVNVDVECKRRCRFLFCFVLFCELILGFGYL